MGASGAVLCGGRSTRMGRDKAMVEVDGVPMAGRVAAALRAAGCHPVLAIGGDAPALAAIGLDAVADDHPGEGPLGGILTALRCFEPMPASAQAVVIVSCDVPWLTPAVVRALVDAPVATTSSSPTAPPRAAVRGLAPDDQPCTSAPGSISR